MIALCYHFLMAQVLVRDLDDRIVARLKVMAKAQNISLEQKFRDMAAREVQLAEERFERAAARIRESTRGVVLDTTAMIREDRDR
ncbi:MAG: plasmid stability protein [Brevundimonas sp.]|nr:MAG: plasmid stability protein [Brevundimonas sp.]